MRITLLLLFVSLLFSAACSPDPVEQGPIGPPGATGPQGPKGDPGASGAGLTTRYFCSGTSALGAGVEVTAYYARYDFADGSAFVDCSVTPSGAGLGRTDALFPLFYKSADVEIADGTCDVKRDLDTTDGSGLGVFEFRVPRDSMQGRATYRDASSWRDGAIISLNCSVN